MPEIIIPKRYDAPNGRFYYTDEDDLSTYKPSVTTILNQTLDKGIGLMHWYGKVGLAEAQKIFHEAGERGDRVHINCAAMMQGFPMQTNQSQKEVEGFDGFIMPDDESKMLLGFDKWLQDFEPIIRGIEMTMYHPDLPYAGTADIIWEASKRVELKNPKRIIEKGSLNLTDIKSGGEYKDHQYQITGYGQLYLKIYRRKPRLSVLRLYEWKGSPKYSYKPYPYCIRPFNIACELWNHWADDPRPLKRAALPDIIAPARSYYEPYDEPELEEADDQEQTAIPADE